MKNFEGTTKTKSGIECVVGAFNSCANLYLGKVKDGWSSDPARPWTTCSWKKNGQCVNRRRTDLDL